MKKNKENENNDQEIEIVSEGNELNEEEVVEESIPEKCEEQTTIEETRQEGSEEISKVCYSTKVSKGNLVKIKRNVSIDLKSNNMFPEYMRSCIFFVKSVNEVKGTVDLVVKQDRYDSPEIRLKISDIYKLQ